MPTHVTTCIVCEESVSCCNDVHALSSGGLHGEGGCENPPFIEFCSLDCCLELQYRLVRAVARYKLESGAAVRQGDGDPGT